MPTISTPRPKVALISPKVIGAKNQIRRAQAPLGIACIAAVLEQRGYKDILIIDAAGEDYENVVPVPDDPALIKFGLSDEGMIAKLRAFGPDVVGISALFSSQVECALLEAKAIKAAFPGVTIVLGGNHASNMYQSIMEAQEAVDFILIGESDYNFADFLEKYFELSNGDYKTTPGLVRREAGEIKKNPPPAFIKNLDELPFPAWHLMDMENYFKIGMPHNPFVKSNRVGCIMTSRGCPQYCYFCSASNYFGHAFRAMSSSRVVAMVKYMVKRFDIHEIQIEDDSFTTNYKRVIEICEGIEDLGLRITLPNAVRADVPINPEKRLSMFKAMRAAGCEQLGISVEHGDQDFLDNVIGKRLDLNEVVTSIDLAHEAGILVHANFMMGFPHETAKQRQKTIEFAKSLKADSFSVSLATPLPGTRMWDLVLESDLVLEGFNPNRVLYVYPSIKPVDITPQELYDTVQKLNQELNEAGQKRRSDSSDKYKLFKGKSASGDRKYHFIPEDE